MEPVSIVIPVRIDSPEREANLHAALRYLLQTPFVYIDILEADRERRFFFGEHERIRYRFIPDTEPVFYRTRFLNILLKEARHDIAGVWDTDVLVPEPQLCAAITLIRKGCVMCFPYDGDFRFLSPEESDAVRADLSTLRPGQGIRMIGRPSVGGAFLVHRSRYLEAGGENEGFYGWAPEDAERVKRLEILELPIARTPGSLYHLHHSRKEDTGVDNLKKALYNQKVLLHTCAQSKSGLLDLLEKRKGVFGYMEGF